MGIKAKWFTGIFLTLNALLHAQQNKIDTLRIYHIDEVTITSSKVSSKEIIPVQIMEGKQLENILLQMPYVIFLECKLKTLEE